MVPRHVRVMQERIRPPPPPEFDYDSLPFPDSLPFLLWGFACGCRVTRLEFEAFLALPEQQEAIWAEAIWAEECRVYRAHLHIPLAQFLLQQGEKPRAHLLSGGLSLDPSSP